MSPPASPPALYPSPGYPYPMAGSYGYPPASYFPPAWAAPTRQPTRAAANGAVVFFVLVAVRDFFMIFFVIADGPFQMRWASLPFGDYWVLALFPAFALVASGYCASNAANPRDRERMVVAALVSVVGSSFPGVVVLGPFGALFAGLGLALYLKSQRTARAASGAGIQPPPPNP